MRDRAKVTKLKISDDQIQAIKHIQENVFDKKRLSSNIKDVLKCSLCCLCSEVPSVEVSYDLGGFRKLEYYCDSCISKVYERDEPTDRDSLAKKYGIIAVDSEDMPRRNIFNKTD